MWDWLLNYPLGAMLGWFVDKFNSYGWGLLGFTVAIKLILLPLGFLQQRSTINQMKVRPKEEAIRKRCGNDKMRANLEVSELYKENGVSAASGCLPMLIQLPLLFALYKIIRKPLTYIVGLTEKQIFRIDELLGLGEVVDGVLANHTSQVVIAEGLFKNLPAMVEQGVVEPGIRTFSYEFLGLNLAETPTLAFNLLLIVPLLAGFTSWLQSWYQSKTVPPNAQAESMQRSMNITMPLLSCYIAFSMPAGIGIYWTFSTVFSLLQSMLLNAIWNPRKTLEHAYAALEEEERREKEERKARRKVNLGGLKPGQEPPPEPEAPSPEIQAQLEAVKAARQRNYAKVLKFRDHIPDPLDEELSQEKHGKGGKGE